MICARLLEVWAGQDGFGRGTDRRPACSVPECAEKHAKWLQDLMRGGALGMAQKRARACAVRVVACQEAIFVNGNRRLLFVCCKRKGETEVCFPW
jgi:hypothetical protein